MKDHLNRTEEELSIFKLQQQDIRALGIVNCSCGKTLPVDKAYKCLYCDIYFCVKCGERHWGKTRKEHIEDKDKLFRAYKI